MWVVYYQNLPENLGGAANVLAEYKTKGVLTHGSTYSFDEKFLLSTPVVTWDASLAPKATVIMINVDSRQRSEDGVQPGDASPYLLWCVASCSNGTTDGEGKLMLNYEAPSRTGINQYGTQRYIFMVFRQDDSLVDQMSAAVGFKVIEMHKGGLKRKRWDLHAFMTQNPQLTPLGYTFMYGVGEQAAPAAS